MIQRATLEFTAGTTIESAYKKAKNMQDFYNIKEVIINFNGCLLCVKETTSLNEVLSKYRRNE